MVVSARYIFLAYTFPPQSMQQAHWAHGYYSVYSGRRGNVAGMDEEKLAKLRERVVEGRIAPTLVSLALPIVAARLLGSIQESVDAIFLGRVSTQDLAAPAAVWPLVWLFMGISMGLTSATVAIVSQLVGARRFREAGDAAGKLLAMNIALSLASMVIVVVSAPLVFRLQAIPDTVMPLALAYLYIDAIGIPFNFMLFFFMMLSNSTGDTKTPFKLSALASGLNLLLDPVLIFGLGPLPEMGVVGAALATTISRIITGGLALYLLLTGYLGYEVKPKRPDRWIVKTALRTGGPIAGQQVLVSSGFLVMMSIVARLGDVVMAAYNLSLAIIHIIQTSIWGFNAATATMIGQALGAGMPDRAKRIARVSLAIVGGMLTLGSAILYLFSEPVVSVFTSIPEVKEVSIRMIRILSPAVPFLGVFFIAQGIARGSGHTGFMSLLGTIRLWLLRIPAAYILAFHMGLGDTGVWLSMTLSNVIAGLAAAAWVLRGGWAKPIVREREAKPVSGVARAARGA